MDIYVNPLICMHTQVTLITQHSKSISGRVQPSDGFPSAAEAGSVDRHFHRNAWRRTDAFALPT